MHLKYAVREPENITSNTTLLVLLHGYGSNEKDLLSFAPDLPEDWLVLSFRAPSETPQGGFGWYDINFMDVEKLIDVPQAEAAVKALTEAILEISNGYGLQDNETHLAGFSQGGILSYSLALNYPELFTKIACMSCYPEMRILKEVTTDKKALANLRFFISHGTDDAVIPLEWGRKGADYLYEKSCYFSFREYMSGHGVNQKNYMDLMEFFKA